MSSSIVRNALYKFRKPTRWDKGIGAKLPEAYKKFWTEWKIKEPTAVHYIKEEGRWKRNEVTGQPERIVNIALPLLYPKELDEGIWGGEAIVEGYIRKSEKLPIVPKFFVPRLLKSVVYSEVLNTYMRTIITRRTIDLIHEHYGFDHYLLKTPACDLRSQLALGLKRKILIALADKTLYPDDPVKREEVYEKYKEYLKAYTREEIEWYGLSWVEACEKYIKEKENAKVVEPLKKKYRIDLINELKKIKLGEQKEAEKLASQSWLEKVNPFARSEKS
ncbi:39S ribosomal protein L28, mitochondrial [Chelonus insularis]|uniref:39S ribosomal protein L28, mitochondrial n=1 Tax=Chelonus insularis TaxID=460826 RepID=UPI001588BD06|nr:39S ribosomal protein L28, mitochondrial [Chelonus insularis]